MSEQNITMEQIELASAVLAAHWLMDTDGLDALASVLTEHGYDTETYANMLDKATDNLTDEQAVEIFCCMIKETLPTVVKLSGKIN